MATNYLRLAPSPNRPIQLPMTLNIIIVSTLTENLAWANLDT